MDCPRCKGSGGPDGTPCPECGTLAKRKTYFLPDPHAEVERIATLEVVLGGGAFLAGLASLLCIPAIRAPGQNWNPASLAIVLPLGLGGLVAFAIGYFAGGTRRLPAIVTTIAGTIGLGATLTGIALPVLEMTEFSILSWGLAGTGTVVLAAGMGIRARREWGRLLHVALALPAALGLVRLGVWAWCWEWEYWVPVDERVLRLAAILAFLSALSVLVAFGLFLSPKIRPVFSGPARVSGERGKRGHGGTSILMVILLLIGWTVGAWAVPYMAKKSQLSAQRKTSWVLGTVRNAIGAWAVDHPLGPYPETQSMDELATILEPTYLPTYVPKLPKTDGWGWPIEYYRVWLPPGEYLYETIVIRSPGADGRFEQEDPTGYREWGPVEGVDRDIVCNPPLEYGFSQWPEGHGPPCL